MHDPLPPGATEASYIRYHMAHELALLSPQLIGHEVILTGSVSRGISDEHSDIEMVFYGESIPTTDERDNWLRSIHATDIIHDIEPIGDHSLWSTFLFHDIWVETGWQTLSQHETNLHSILAGETSNHQQLVLAEITAHAIPLYSTGFLNRWQQELTHYPDTLPHKIISDVAELWRFPNVVNALWAVAQRGENLALAERLVRDFHNMLRLLFALNRQWEPDWKWVKQTSKNLHIKPKHLSERINRTFLLPTPTQRVTACQQLVYESLQLVSAEYNVSQALATFGKA